MKFYLSFLTLVYLAMGCGFGQNLPLVKSVEIQPLLLQVKRLSKSLDYLGVPLSKTTLAKLDQATKEKDRSKSISLVQEALDPLCLFAVTINPESRVKVSQGPANLELVENGWRLFLIKVQNDAGVTAQLRGNSPQAKPIHNAKSTQVFDLWLDMQLYDERPLNKNLSGVKLEYRVVQLYSRDKGKRSALFSFDVGQGTQDIGFRNDILLTFNVIASTPVKLNVFDEDGKGTTAGFVIRDKKGRIYPSPSKRIAPDFRFHPQIYRSNGQSINLPPGEYSILCTRGPEYIKQTRLVKVGKNAKTLKFQLKRWVNPAKYGWWSGDHHIHAAGCSHYSSPTQGVHPSDMILHCIGEDLKVGAALTWGPCFDYQKQFFTAKEDEVSRYPYLLRYDIEVSGFGSHQSGHLCLLRLKSQIPPGGNSKTHWPTLGLNTLRWAKKQGAITGPAHSGAGLAVNSSELPNYIIPPFDGIGANEHIVDITHKVPGPDGKLIPAIDFISMGNTPFIWELNMWYHTLNIGFRTRISGETDFPCMTGKRVGLSRSYVKVDGKLTYDKWCTGIQRGMAYVSDGRSHIMDFKANGLELGKNANELHLQQPAAVKIQAKVSALLNVAPDPIIKTRRYTQQPYWHLERARIGNSRKVHVELVVNSKAVERKVIEANGKLRDIVFHTKIKQSSWVALRILPSSHTNPFFIMVANKPIRTSQSSARWCLKSVDQCWFQKKRFIAAKEMKDAIAAYDHARKVYKKRIAECVDKWSLLMKEASFVVTFDRNKSMPPYPVGTQKMNSLPVQNTNNPIAPFFGLPIFYNQGEGQHLYFKVKHLKNISSITFTACAFYSMVMEVRDKEGRILGKSVSYSNGNLLETHTLKIKKAKEFTIHISNTGLEKKPGYWFFLKNITLK